MKSFWFISFKKLFVRDAFCNWMAVPTAAYTTMPVSTIATPGTIPTIPAEMKTPPRTGETCEAREGSFQKRHEGVLWYSTFCEDRGVGADKFSTI
jgi:hypothetical protein